MTDVQARVQAQIDEIVAGGGEHGVQVAAYFDGELVVDAWAGVADTTTGRAVDGDTLFTVFSCTKGIAATALHLLAESGKLSYDDPVADYWPEFAANGKEQVTVRHSLSHTAGIPQMPEGVTIETMCDWDEICRAIAALPPLWEPGTKCGYHALTFGWIVGEIARRADGRPLAQIVQEAICTPLGIEDLYLGIPDEVEPRVATLTTAASLTSAPPPPPDALARRTIPRTEGPFGELFNRPDLRRASIPGAGGIMTARALARHYAGLAGALGEPRLLPPERVALATAVQVDDIDLISGMPTLRGLGYMLGRPQSVYGDRITVFGHAGHGGTIGFADPDYRFAFALVKNLLTIEPPGEDTATRVARTVRQALNIPGDT